MGLLAYLHGWSDNGLACVRMVTIPIEVGWFTVGRKACWSSRRDGEFAREQQPLFKKIKLLLPFNPLLEWIDTLHIFLWYLHERAEMEEWIESFIDFYHIHMDELKPSDPGAYPPKARSMCAEGDLVSHLNVWFLCRSGFRLYRRGAVCSSDCRAVVYDTVFASPKKSGLKVLTSESQHPSNLLTTALPGTSLRLSPRNYHRLHSPVSGKVEWWKAISGDHSVDPLCLRSRIDALTQNAKCALAVDSPEFRLVLFVAIGAMGVGAAQGEKGSFSEEARTPGAEIEKGNKLGIFEFGGSSIVS
ncbi:phosphatidylserine decarboxylase [Tuber brumale]|nr:phosphatidylserine decarboxylase [Tuber brumale]